MLTSAANGRTGLSGSSGATSGMFHADGWSHGLGAGGRDAGRSNTDRQPVGRPSSVLVIDPSPVHSRPPTMN